MKHALSTGNLPADGFSSSLSRMIDSMDINYADYNRGTAIFAKCAFVM